MRLIQAMIILEHECERFGRLHIGDAGAVSAIRTYRKLLPTSIARDNAPNDVFRRVNFKLLQLYRYRTERRNPIFVSLVTQAGFLSCLFLLVRGLPRTTASRRPRPHKAERATVLLLLACRRD